MMTAINPTVEQTGKQSERRETAASQTAASQTAALQTAASDKICWLEVKRYPYQPDHQVELMHLQAEADALLIELQANRSQGVSESDSAGL